MLEIHVTFLPTDKMVAPTFTRKLRDSHAIVGKSMEMNLKVTGTSPIKISWYHNGKEITAGQNYEIQQADNTCTLKILKLSLSDSGTYKCRAVNSAGTSETSASLVIKGQ